MLLEVTEQASHWTFLFTFSLSSSGSVEQVILIVCDRFWHGIKNEELDHCLVSHCLRKLGCWFKMTLKYKWCPLAILHCGNWNLTCTCTTVSFVAYGFVFVYSGQCACGYDEVLRSLTMLFQHSRSHVGENDKGFKRNFDRHHCVWRDRIHLTSQCVSAYWKTVSAFELRIFVLW